ncbi:putative thiamine-phosphate synthase 2 [Gammaproteobacteria bacterium]
MLHPKAPTLSRKLFITFPSPEEEFFQRLERALSKGVDLIQLRLPSFSEEKYEIWAKKVLALCKGYGTQIILNAAPELVLRLGANGVHLSSARLASLSSRPLPPEYLVFAACHNAEELEKAQHIEADFVTLSPVLPTASHPGAPTLGWVTFGKLVSSVNIPVYALGGMTPDHLSKALALGAQGIAMLSAGWA